MMNSTAVKICGLQGVEVLKSMLNLPVDYIGLVFAKSRRQLSIEQAKPLIEQISYWENAIKPQSVGVFVNPTLTELTHLLESLPLDVIQLHGQESAAFCEEVKELGVKVFKFLPMKREGASSEQIDYSLLDQYAGVIDGLLLDTFDPHVGGGSGKTFDWSQITPYQTWASEKSIPLFVAGGLHPDNVGALVSEFGPDGVDVSSGVETNGVKDIEKVVAFVERVKTA